MYVFERTYMLAHCTWGDEPYVRFALLARAEKRRTFFHHMVDEPYVRFAGATPLPKRRTFWEARHGRRPTVVTRDPKRRFGTVLAPGGAMERWQLQSLTSHRLPPPYAVRTLVYVRTQCSSGRRSARPAVRWELEHCVQARKTKSFVLVLF